MFKKPILARCDNRASMPRVNTTTGSPEEWFDNSNTLNQLGLEGFSFDFFVNWSADPLVINQLAWVKRILTVSPSGLITNGIVDTQTVHNYLVDFEGEEHLRRVAKYCKNNRLKLEYLLFRDVDWENSPEEIIVVDISIEENLVLEASAIDITVLKERIINYSGGPINMGRKGLMYGTTTLECYLSNTSSLYPGDVDLVVFDIENYNSISMLEFKKHNLDGAIQEQRLSNYYPRPDGRKYDRLAVLRDYLGMVSYKCIYYPTRVSDYGKIENIEGDVGNLMSGQDLIIALPRSGNNQTIIEFVKNVLAI